MSEMANELRMLEKSFGWEILKRHLEARRASCINELLTVSDVDKIRMRQAWVAACDYILHLPRQLIEEDTRDRKENGQGRE